MQHRYVYAYRYRNDTYTAILAQILPDPRFPGPSTSTDNTRLSSPIPKPVKIYFKKNPIKIIAFARIPGQISPVNFEALSADPGGVEGCGYLEDDAGGSEVGDRGVERGGAVGADGRDGEERHSGSSDKFSA